MCLRLAVSARAVSSLKPLSWIAATLCAAAAGGGDQLSYYSVTSPGGGGTATITLPANTSWTQADLEHAAAIGSTYS